MSVVFNDSVRIPVVTPGTPPSGFAEIYPKSDGLFYAKNDAGTEYQLAQGSLIGGSRMQVARMTGNGEAFTSDTTPRNLPGLSFSVKAGNYYWVTFEFTWQSSAYVDCNLFITSSSTFGAESADSEIFNAEAFLTNSSWATVVGSDAPVQGVGPAGRQWNNGVSFLPKTASNNAQVGRGRISGILKVTSDLTFTLQACQYASSASSQSIIKGMATVTQLTGTVEEPTFAANSVYSNLTGSVDVLSANAISANQFLARASTGNLAAKTITNQALNLLDDTTGSAMMQTIGVMTEVPKTTDETRASSSTLTTDSTLKFTTPSTGTYMIRLVAYLNVANSTMDYKYASVFGGTATVKWSLQRHMVYGVASGTDNETTAIGSAQIASTAVTSNSGSGVARVEIEMCMVVTANGEWGFQWAQNTSDPANIICLAGSQLEWKKIA